MPWPEQTPFAVRVIATKATYRVMAYREWRAVFPFSNVVARLQPGDVFDVSVPTGLDGVLRMIARRHLEAVLEASAFHDRCLQLQWPRGIADAVFDEILRARGVPRWRRVAVSAPVMLCGLTT